MELVKDNSTSSAEQSQSEKSSGEQSSKFDLLTRVLEGENVTEDELASVQGEAVVIPDEHLGEALRLGMLTIHKELTSTLEMFTLVAQRAKLNAEADKEQRVIKPLAGGAILLWDKVGGYTRAVRKADERRLLPHRHRMLKFCALYESVLPGLRALWDARDADPDSDEAVEALKAVGKLSDVAFKSEGFVTFEAKRERAKLKPKERALMDAMSIGLHERRARAKRDKLVGMLGGQVEPEEQEPS